MKARVSTAAGVVSVGLAMAASAADGLTAARLRCEYRVDPRGIDEAAPRLSWIVESGQRAQRQTAFRVLVADDAERLGRDEGDLWDSGKTAGDDTTCIVYAGQPLASGQACFWKVKVWDRDGRESPWSPPARWSMGLLRPADWKAQWIGFDRTRPGALPDAPFEGARWIWFAKDPSPAAPQGKRAFLATLQLPAGEEIARADLLVTGDDSYTLNLNGMRVAVSEPGGETFRKAAQLDVKRFLVPGDNEVRAVVDNAVESPAGLLVKLTVETAGGKTVTRVTDDSWLATDKPAAAATNRAAWSACRVIGDYGIAPWGRIKAAGIVMPPAAYLRTGFTTGKPVARAMLYASAFGWFDVHLNGRRVSDEWFNPGWTDYRRRVYYRAYDVTALLRPGVNALGAVLSDGWYSGYIGWYGQRDHYGAKPRFLAQLEIEYADGSRETVASGPGWKAAIGPVQGSDILMGEAYDARKEIAGWDAAGFDDSAWSAADTGAERSPVLQAHPGPPVVTVREFRAQKVTEPKPGVYVLDLGQNFAGVVRLQVRGEPGQAITLRHAERLNPDGTIYTINLRGARATDTYLCRGGGVETWTPRFTFHGFQYVEVTGLKTKPGPETVVGLALSSDTPDAGAFECSDPMLNRLRSNIYWTQRMNFIDIPTDCPQRDERLGWTGDAQVYVRTATLNADVQSFFTKWLVDLEDAQREDGQFPKVAPVLVTDADGGPAWADAGVICPWTVYEVYGDRRLLERRYESMKRFIEFCRSRSTPEGLPPSKYHCYGDWLSIQASTPKDVIYTAYFAHSARLVARAAEVLGQAEDQAKYEALFEKIKAGFRGAFIQPDGRIKGDTQAGYVLALASDLVEGDLAKKAAQYLGEDIEQRGHLSTGFIGTKDLMLVLAKIGRNDLAYRLIHNETFPSWGFSIKHDATSIWERWDGWTPEKGFQTPGMNSFAHYSFGAVYQWMVENIGGIRNAGPGYREIVLAPEPGGRLASARVGYDSIRGRIESKWARKEGRFELDATIPANTMATIVLPAKAGATVTEGGQPVEKADGIRVLGAAGDRMRLAVGSGRYRFTVEGP